VVKLDGRVIRREVEPIYIALNKPPGIICTTDESVTDNIISYLKYPERLFPVGRLDKDSEGLIFLTNDGDIVNKILRAGNAHEKVYVVDVDKPITEDFVQKMSSGVPILGTKTKRCKVSKLKDRTFEITLTQGLNRQIRRMCEKLGYEVTRLKRTQIMNVTLKGLNTGQWRELDDESLRGIFEMVADSSKTEEASPKKNSPKSRKKSTGKPGAGKGKTEASDKASSRSKKKPDAGSKSRVYGKPKSKGKGKPASGKRIGKSKPAKAQGRSKTGRRR
jgi:23S rRNA pseudouridine2604 synthase